MEYKAFIACRMEYYKAISFVSTYTIFILTLVAVQLDAKLKIASQKV